MVWYMQHALVIEQFMGRYWLWQDLHVYIHVVIAPNWGHNMTCQRHLVWIAWFIFIVKLVLFVRNIESSKTVDMTWA